MSISSVERFAGRKARRAAWLSGLTILAMLMLVVTPNEFDREVRLLLALITIGLTGLGAEVFAARSELAGRSRYRIPQGARQADGKIEIARIADVEGLILKDRNDLRRFLRLRESTFRASRPIASDPALLGQIVMISVFVGQDDQPWSDDEIANGIAAIEVAGTWIEREAIRYEAPVNLSLADTYFQVDDPDDDPVEVAFGPEGDDVGPLEENAATKAVILASRTAAQFGFADVVEWMNEIHQRVEADATVWLFHARRAGRSIAMTQTDSGIPGVGFALCYSREASFPEPLLGRARVDPTTVAHELLHLFGASDKYGMSLKAYPAGSVSSREIMRLDHESLSRLSIGPLTASEIGWPALKSVQNSP